MLPLYILSLFLFLGFYIFIISFDICLYNYCYNSSEGLTVKEVREHTAGV